MILECFASPGECRSFGLGLVCGLVLTTAAFAVHGTSDLQRDADGTSSSAIAPSGPGWQHPTGSGDLASAVRVSARLLPRERSMVGATGDVPSVGDVEALLASAEQHRRARQFDRACAAYAAVVERGGMTADAWADYADSQASLAGKLAGPPARAIEAALRLEPAHAKALWLKASLAHEEHRYGDALATWRRLLALVPAGSNDARIIEANIAEATRLAPG